jgi:hypothetical protein
VRGIVLGELFADAEGKIVLHAKDESYGARIVRRRQFNIER